MDVLSYKQTELGLIRWRLDIKWRFYHISKQN